MKVKQRYDGKGFSVPSGVRHRMVCCDCGLVHNMVFVSQDGKPIGINLNQLLMVYELNSAVLPVKR